MALQLGYIVLSILMVILFSFIGLKTINSTYSDKFVAKKKIIQLVSALFFWNAYILVMESTGITKDISSFPPKFFLVLILPAFIFTGVFIYLNRNSSWIKNIPESWLIHVQAFRIIIETLFVYSVAAEILPYTMTIEGYNYDMIFAFTAIPVGYLVFQKKALPKSVAIIWNFLGLAVIASIIFVVLSTIFNPGLFGDGTSLLPKNFGLGTYPYLLVPGFLAPAAVFIHVLSIVQLTRK